MRMTFAALAKSLGHAFTSSSSSSSTASGSDIQKRLTKSTTPPVAEHEGENDKEQALEADSDEKAEDIAGKQENEIGGTTQDGGAAETETRPPAPEETTDTADDGEEEDMDIASSRASSPAPAIVSRDTLTAPTSDEQPRTSPAPKTGHAIGTTTKPPNVPLQDVKSGTALPMEMIEHVLNRKMSDDQLDQAKLLVLDLLGWGVTPEYLIQRGISHALLYTVFMDLRLRLPNSIMEDCVKLVKANP